MQSLKQFFSFLNDVNFQYVVLRNWDNLPDSVEFGDHSDLDLLVYDLDHFKELMPDIFLQFSYPRVRYKMAIGDSYIFMDIRHLGDGYYPIDFEKAILETREWNESGFYTPNQIHFWIALAYHAVHHKNENIYQHKLGDTTVKELLEALKKSSVGWVPPVDQSVGRFNPYWNGATSVVTKDENEVTKKQVSFKGYDLIGNEKRVLSAVLSYHFPKVLKSTDDEIVVENCGDRLTVDNLPEDWEQQLVEIVMDLETNKILHRDIKPDNLMVKNGVIKLIDFGWAKLKDDEEMTVPSCLGWPYKSSEGFNDHYSMRKVIKEYKAKLEEKEEGLIANFRN